MFPKAAVTHNVAGGEAGLSNAKQRLGLSNAETRGQPPTREAMASQGGRRAGIVERESDETTRPRTTGPRRPRRVIGKQNCRAGASPADPSNGKREHLPYKSVVGGQRSENDEAPAFSWLRRGKRIVRAGLALNDEGMTKPE